MRWSNIDQGDSVKQNLSLLVAIRENGLRQQDFARIVGDDPAIVSRAINGTYNLDDRRKIRYARALRRKPEEIFSDD